jgi:Holliday junction DNA helicase RuvA
MIGSLRGAVLDRLPVAGGGGQVLLEVAGVGYRLTVTPSTLAGAQLGEPLFLHVHTHVREDAIVLYGFASREERTCFEALLAAHGVGPALALAFLSSLSPSALGQAVATDDVDVLTAVPGVGRKTAARLLVELKSRLDLPLGDLGGDGSNGSARSEVRTALAGLGYAPDEIRMALREADPDASLQEQLTTALRQLAPRRAPAVVEGQ